MFFKLLDFFFYKNKRNNNILYKKKKERENMFPTWSKIPINIDL